MGEIVEEPMPVAGEGQWQWCREGGHPACNPGKRCASRQGCRAPCPQLTRTWSFFLKSLQIQEECSQCWVFGGMVAAMLDFPVPGALSSPVTDTGISGGSDCKVSACNAGDLGSIPGSGRCPGEGNGTPLQYSCLENPMDGGAW